MMNKTKVLIIDDEEDFTHLVKLNLENTGRYKVYTASNGGEGIRTAQRKKQGDPRPVRQDKLQQQGQGHQP